MTTSKADTAAYRWLNTKELKHMLKLFDEHLEQVTDDTCRYKPGWSDQRVADEVRAASDRKDDPKVAFKASSVATRRNELYGQLVAGAKAPPATVARLDARVKELEDRVKVLEDLLTK